jgi:hypothetical protein
MHGHLSDTVNAHISAALTLKWCLRTYSEQLWKMLLVQKKQLSKQDSRGLPFHCCWFYTHFCNKQKANYRLNISTMTHFPPTCLKNLNSLKQIKMYMCVCICTHAHNLLSRCLNDCRLFIAHLEALW